MHSVEKEAGGTSVGEKPLYLYIHAFIDMGIYVVLN